MSIREEAEQYARDVRGLDLGATAADRLRAAYIAGAERTNQKTPLINEGWVCGKCARVVALGVDDGQIPEHHRTCPKQADREPSDADVRAALSEWYRGIIGGGWTEQDEARMRAALLAAQEVRNRG